MHVLQGHSETPEEEEDGRIAASLAGGVKGEWRGPMQILHVFCVLGLTGMLNRKHRNNQYANYIILSSVRLCSTVPGENLYIISATEVGYPIALPPNFLAEVQEELPVSLEHSLRSPDHP